MWFQLGAGVGLFCLMHVLVWFSTNLQLVSWASSMNTVFVAVALSVPATLCAYYGTKMTYEALDESLWSVRFIGFGVSYLVFPILTWLLLGETMFTAKTLLCIFLSVLIVCIQVFL